MSEPTKIYPIRGRWLPGVPAAVQVVATKGQAEELVASGAFTVNPNDADRDHDAQDLSADQAEPVEFERTYMPGERETEPLASDAPAGGPIDANPAEDTETKTAPRKTATPTGTPPAAPTTADSGGGGEAAPA